MKYLIVLLALIAPAFAQTLPEAPTPHAFFDRTNIALMSVSATSIAADGFTTRNFVNHEMNPLARPFVHSNGKAAIYFGSSQAAVTGGMFLLHKTHHHQLERILPVVVTGIEAFWSIHNAGLKPFPKTVVPSVDNSNHVTRY